MTDTPDTQALDTLILGAGAAGLMCAAHARGRTLVVEHARAPGEKIRISGGGRCNFTNLHAGPDNFIGANPHFPKSALSRYTQWDFIDLMDRHRIAWHEKTLGQLFCDGSARQVVAMLMDEATGAGAEVCAAHPAGGAGPRRGAVSPPPDRDRRRKAPRHRAAAGGGDRGQVDPGHGRHRHGPRHRAAVRPRGDRNPARAGAADLFRGRFRSAGRRVAAGARRRRRRGLRRGAAVHPSRAVGAGDPAGVVLLATRARR